MNLVSAVNAIRATQPLSWTTDDPEERLVLDYLTEYMNAYSAGRAVKLLSGPDRTLRIAEALLQYWSDPSLNFKARLQKLVDLRIHEKSVENPGPNNFWLIEIQFIIAICLVNLTRHLEAVAYLERVIQLSEHEGFIGRAGSAISVLFTCSMNIGDFTRFKELLSRAAIFAQHPESSPGQVAYFHMQKALWFMLRGQLSDVVHELDQAQGILEKQPLHSTSVEVLCMRAQVFWRHGDLKSLAQALSDARELIAMRTVDSEFNSTVQCQTAALSMRGFNLEMAKAALAEVRTESLGLLGNLFCIHVQLELSSRQGQSAPNDSYQNAKTILANYQDWETGLIYAYWRQSLIRVGLTAELRSGFEKASRKAALNEFPWDLLQLAILKLEMILLESGRRELAPALHNVIELARRYGFIYDEKAYLQLSIDLRKSWSLAAGKKDLQRLRELQVEGPKTPLAELWPYRLLFGSRELPRLEFDWDKGKVIDEFYRRFDLPEKPGVRAFLRVLVENSNIALTYEYLTERLWAESYNPPVHKNRLYGLAVELRAFLRRNGLPVECLANEASRGYSFRSQS